MVRNARTEGRAQPSSAPPWPASAGGRSPSAAGSECGTLPRRPTRPACLPAPRGVALPIPGTFNITCAILCAVLHVAVPQGSRASLGLRQMLALATAGRGCPLHIPAAPRPALVCGAHLRRAPPCLPAGSLQPSTLFFVYSSLLSPQALIQPPPMLLYPSLAPPPSSLPPLPLAV